VGHDLDGYGDVALEHSVAVEWRRHGYVDSELLAESFQELYVIKWKSGLIFVMLPHEQQKEVVITASHVCGRNDGSLLEPVYIWENVMGWYQVLDCRSGMYTFKTQSDLETWLREAARGHKLPWIEWYVVPGIVTDEDSWIDVVKRAEIGEIGPTPDEVIDQVLRLTA
jgi:hypothetical protein